MDISSCSLITGEKDMQISSFGVPMTPVKPIPPKPQPICAERRGNQENWFAPEGDSTVFAQETQARSTVSRWEKTIHIDINKCFDDWEEEGALAANEFSMGLARPRKTPFADLIALANAATTTDSAYAAQKGNADPTAGPSFSLFNSLFQGNPFEASLPANQGNTLGSNLWSNGSCAPDSIYGYSIHHQSTFDLTSQPRASSSSRNCPSQFAPITPDQSKKAENNKQAHDMQCTHSDERRNEARDKQGCEDSTTLVEVVELQHDKEQQQIPNDLSSAAVSTQLQENHNPDKEGNSGIDLNSTPQQKPRRRKHRPKVVVEGKPKRTPKPVTPNPADLKEKLSGKRKYVRKNSANKTPGISIAEVTSRSTDTKTASRPTRSCKRTLNFDFESEEIEESFSCRPRSNISAETEAQNIYSRVESKSTVQLGEGMEVTVEKTQVGIAYDLTRSMNKVLEDYLSMPETQSPSPQDPTRTDSSHANLKAHTPNEHSRGKCRIVFSDETHDKQESATQMTKTDNKSAESPNNSNCSTSTCLTEREQVRELKRGHSCTSDEVETSRTNVMGGNYSSLPGYMAMVPANFYNYPGIPGLYFPPIYKKRRTEKGHSSSTSGSLSMVTHSENRVKQAIPWPPNTAFAASYEPESNCRFPSAQFNASSTSTKTSVIDARGKQQKFGCELAMDQKEMMRKKRSKGPTRARNLDSLFGILDCRQLPIFPAEGAATRGYLQGYDISQHPHTCIEALVAETRATMTTKKRTKRNTFGSSVTTDVYDHHLSLGKSTDAFQKRSSHVDELVEQLRCINITPQEHSALVPYNTRYAKQNSIVLYERDGTVVPFEGSFDPVRKRRPRPKVDLDEETTRVWKLLLENINSEGIDGTDEEKAKWWEEERGVFQGRADSFIARMHLVQGDRRFSPWKGSVVDSVVGVFLTQNVSDHLSSSAFMSLAARFPFKSKSYDIPGPVETDILVEEPEVRILDPVDVIKWQEERSNQLARDRSSMTPHNMDYNLGNDVDTNDYLGSSSGDEKSTNSLDCKSSDIYGYSPEKYGQSTVNRAAVHLKEAEASFMGDREMNDVLSSQYSSGSSQNSVDSSVVQTAERIGFCLQDNLERDTTTKSNPNSLIGSSFVELLLSTERTSQYSGGSSQNSVDSSMAQDNERIGSSVQDLSEAELATRSKSNNLFDSCVNRLHNAQTFHGLIDRKVGNTSCYQENGHRCTEGSERATQEHKEELDNCQASLMPIGPSCNYHLQMTPNSGFPEVEYIEMQGGESIFSYSSKASERSVITEESVSQATVQKIMITPFQEAEKSPSQHNHVCSSFQEEASRIFFPQDGPDGNPKGKIQSQTQGHGHRMQQVLKVPNLSKDAFDVTESTSMINYPKNTEHKEVESSLNDHRHLHDSSKVKRARVGKQKQNPVDWDSLRLQAQAEGKTRERTANTTDSLDWEAVRSADVDEIAKTIKERGMNNILAERIKEFLNRIVREHGSLDLEWLRDVPPDKAKEFLLSVRGLGLKSVECVRLLTLHHLAFPVDTNVGRIAVRLGWVPLQPLPESLQLHLLELYPVLESIQRYLWPRLCKLDQRTLYELHYQMITFGKVFCTKSKPNCNACPMRGECRHFASAFASARLALPGPEQKSIVTTTEKKAEANQSPVEVTKPLQLPPPWSNQLSQPQCQSNNCEPIIEVPASPEPNVEVPATPEPEPEALGGDIEDASYEDPEDIPTIKLNIEEFTQTLQNYMQQNMELQEGVMSKALVALTSEAASIPTPKLKNVSQLRTEHQVYELPDCHPLIEGLDKREPDDPCSYLLAIWTPGETPSSIQPPERKCSSQECGELCDENTCFSCNSIREANSQTVRGTLLIPCRTAMRGSFPLNGTYFQVNEVFADHDSSINPIDVPRAWIWNLPRRTVYFGTSIPSIFKGLSTESIQYCFWRGFVCVRGFDQKTRAPRPLMARLHFPASKLKGRGKATDKQE